MAVIDMTGEVRGKLTIIGRAENHHSGNAMWNCVCACGRAVLASGISLRRTTRPTRSCGCFAIESKVTHGHTRKGNIHPIYRTWYEMRSRCQVKSHRAYTRYGGRGIYVCERWDRDFTAFIGDIGEKSSASLSIDRINNAGGYTCGKHDLCDDCREKNAPANCKWADDFEQNNNKRTNKVFEHDGRSLTLAQWERETGIDRRTIRSRVVEHGWSIARALTEGVHLCGNAAIRERENVQPCVSDSHAESDALPISPSTTS
jgi:hypothetical protein